MSTVHPHCTGCYGRVAPRSGLAWKNHIDVGAGVIDADCQFLRPIPPPNRSFRGQWCAHSFWVDYVFELQTAATWVWSSSTTGRRTSRSTWVTGWPSSFWSGSALPRWRRSKTWRTRGLIWVWVSAHWVPVEFIGVTCAAPVVINAVSAALVASALRVSPARKSSWPTEVSSPHPGQPFVHFADRLLSHRFTHPHHPQRPSRWRPRMIDCLIATTTKSLHLRLFCLGHLFLAFEATHLHDI